MPTNFPEPTGYLLEIAIDATRGRMARTGEGAFAAACMTWAGIYDEFVAQGAAMPAIMSVQAIAWAAEHPHKENTPEDVEARVQMGLRQWKANGPQNPQ